MDTGNCSLLDANLSLGNLSESCILPGAPLEKGGQIEISYVRWLASYVYDLSCAELKLPGTPVALYLGSWAGLIEVLVVMVCGLLFLAAVGALCQLAREAASLPRCAKAGILGAVGLGMPLLPFAVLELHGPMRTMMSNFSMSLLASVGFFRWAELAFRTGPTGIDRSMRSAALYFSSVAEVLFDNDGRALAPPPGRRWQLFWSALGHAAALLLVIGIGEISKFTPFLGPGVDLLRLPLLGFPWSLPAVWLQAAWTYLSLSATIESGRFIWAIFGVETHIAMRHPLLLSTSVRDFWGRRWNLLIHRLMHRSFFTPLKVRCGPRAGAVAAFLASALFHEYSWLLVNWEVAQFKPGGPLAFFAVQFVLLTVEALLKRTSLGCAAGRLPSPAQTLLTTLAILPFGPLFLSDLSRAGLLLDTARLFPHPRLVA